MKKITKLTTVAILCAMPFVATQANAQQASQKQIDSAIQQLLKLGIPVQTDQELIKQGCNPDVWGDMVNQYIKARGIKLTVENEAKEQIQMETPKNDWQSCFSNALGKINQLKNKANKIWAMFTGEFSFEEAANGAADDFFEDACRAVNNASGKIVGGVTNEIGSQMDKGVDKVVDKVNDISGDLNMGDRIMDTNKKNEDDPLFKEGNYSWDDLTGGTASKISNPSSTKEVTDKYMGMFGGSSDSSGSAFSSFLK